MGKRKTWCELGAGRRGASAAACAQDGLGRVRLPRRRDPPGDALRQLVVCLSEALRDHTGEPQAEAPSAAGAECWLGVRVDVAAGPPVGTAGRPSVAHCFGSRAFVEAQLQGCERPPAGAAKKTGTKKKGRA